VGGGGAAGGVSTTTRGGGEGRKIPHRVGKELRVHKMLKKWWGGGGGSWGGGVGCVVGVVGGGGGGGGFCFVFWFWLVGVVLFGVGFCCGFFFCLVFLVVLCLPILLGRTKAYARGRGNGQVPIIKKEDPRNCTSPTKTGGNKTVSA